jgi:hypothetical protein
VERSRQFAAGDVRRTGAEGGEEDGGFGGDVAGRGGGWGERCLGREGGGGGGCGHGLVSFFWSGGGG